MANKYISKIQLPGGDEQYLIKDASAWAQIELLEKQTFYIGNTTTEIKDGSTTSQIVINEVTWNSATKTDISKQEFGPGSLVTHGNKEFIWDGTRWHELGDLTGLKALAYADTATGSQAHNHDASSTFAGSEGDISVSVTSNVSVSDHSYTPAGTVSQPTFTGTEETISIVSGNANALDIQTSGNLTGATIAIGDADVTLTGTASVAGTATGSVSDYVSAAALDSSAVTSVDVTTNANNAITDASYQHMEASYPSETEELLVLSFVNANVTKVATVTTVSNVTPTLSKPSITLTKGTKNLSLNVDASGDISGTGTNSAAISITGGSVTGEGTIAANAIVVSGSTTYEPTGTVSQPTFTGTAATLEHSVTNGNVTGTGKFTPAGTVTTTTSNTTVSITVRPDTSTGA